MKPYGNFIILHGLQILYDFLMYNNLVHPHHRNVDLVWVDIWSAVWQYEIIKFSYEIIQCAWYWFIGYLTKQNTYILGIGSLQFSCSIIWPRLNQHLCVPVFHTIFGFSDNMAAPPSAQTNHLTNLIANALLCRGCCQDRGLKVACLPGQGQRLLLWSAGAVTSWGFWTLPRRHRQSPESGRRGQVPHLRSSSVSNTMTACGYLFALASPADLAQLRGASRVRNLASSLFSVSRQVSSKWVFYFALDCLIACFVVCCAIPLSCTGHGHADVGWGCLSLACRAPIFHLCCILAFGRRAQLLFPPILCSQSCHRTRAKPMVERIVLTKASPVSREQTVTLNSHFWRSGDLLVESIL